MPLQAPKRGLHLSVDVRLWLSFLWLFDVWDLVYRFERVLDLTQISLCRIVELTKRHFQRVSAFSHSYPLAPGEMSAVGTRTFPDRGPAIAAAV